MMTIENIRKLYVMEPDVVDLEMVAARLEHHKWKLSVNNMFLCDCGDNWRVNMMYNSDPDNAVEAYAPTLRRALADVLTQAGETA